MDNPQPHIELIDPQDAAFARVLGGIGDVLNMCAARQRNARLRNS